MPINVLAGDDGAIIQPNVLSFPAGTTINSATIATPTITGGTISGATISGTISSSSKVSSAQVDATTTTLANITGLTSITLVAGATYRFEIELAGTCGGTGGWKVAFKYTTATLTSIEATGLGYTASAVAVQHSTTTTDQTSLLNSNTAFIYGRIIGSMVVNAGGTLAVQFAENSANSTSSIYAGSCATFVRTA